MFRALRAVALTLVASTAAAQMSMPMPPTVSAAAKAQIEQVKQAAMSLGTPDQARTAGFFPPLGWLPTMGVHWINQSLAGDGKAIKLTAPDQLMFSPIDGKQVLVGAAYSYFAPLTDSTRPPSFDGNPAWHDHPNLAPDGQTLAMLHVWFVPSPDGPFAGHNPNLPYWAAGLTPPDAARFMDPIESARIRKTAMAIGLVVDTIGLFPILQQRPPVHAVVVASREAVRKLLPQLDGKRPQAEWDRAADQAVASWQAVRDAYLASARNPVVNEQIRKLMDEMETGQHAGAGHHH